MLMVVDIFPPDDPKKGVGASFRGHEDMYAPDL
jgi:hypothetical protein